TPATSAPAIATAAPAVATGAPAIATGPPTPATGAPTLASGGPVGPPSSRSVVRLSTPLVSLPDPSFAGDPNEFPFHLLLFPHHTLGAGEAAHLPWLQATPDPVTSAVWRTWV